jgi:HEAT repeat protein
MTPKFVSGIVLLLIWISPCRAAEPLYAGKPLSFWLDELNSRDPLLREEAMLVLADAGTAARAAVPRLEQLFKDERPTVRIRAGLALWRIAGQTKPAIAALTEALRDPTTSDRAQVLRDLSQLGAAASSSASAVLELVDNADILTRNQAVQTLQGFGPAAVPALTAALAEKDARRRRNAADVLSRMGIGARPAQAALERGLKDEDRRVRTACARALWSQGQTTEANAAVLLDAVRSGSDAERQEVLNAVGFMQRSKAALPILKELLKSDNLAMRVRAANAYWDIDPQLKVVLPIYMEGLKNPDFNSRSQATQGIIRVGPEAREAIPALIAIVKTPNAGYAGDVYEALARIGAPSVPPLVELLTTSKANPQVVMGVSHTLSRIGAPAVLPVLPLLDDADLQVRRAATQVIAAAGSGAEAAVPRLRTLLKKDTDFSIRQNALIALGRIGAAAAPAAPDVVELARDKNIALRAASLRALEQIPADAKLVRPLALDAMEDANIMIRCRGVSLLWHVAPKHPDILPHVLELLKQPAGRNEMLELLGQMGPSAGRAVPALTKLLSDRDANARRQAIFALGRIGPAARPAVPQLLEQLRSPNLSVRQNVLNALLAIGGDDARIVPAVVEAARQDNGFNRSLILNVLAAHGSKASAAVPWLVEQLHLPPSAATIQLIETLRRIDAARARKEALPVLRTMLQAPSPWRVQAAEALCRLESGSEEGLNALMECLRSPDVNIRQQASLSLGTLGPAARKAEDDLRKALGDSVPQVRVNAARSLWLLMHETERTLPVLREVLKQASAGTYTRQQAASALGLMGPAAKAALPDLLALRDDPDVYLRNWVRDAITKIEPPANK